MTSSEAIAKFEAKYPQLKVAYGGDGEVVSCWRSAHTAGKIILPVRNYSQCDAHKDFLERLLVEDNSLAVMKSGLQITFWPLLECKLQNASLKKPLQSLAEFTITNDDITSALRFNVRVNNQLFLENVIATGIIVSAALGATCYWSSVTRTIFREGFGLAFIAPTVGVSNLVLKPTDAVTIETIRDCNAKLAADRETQSLKFAKGDVLEFRLSCEKVSIAGFSDFHCQKCRELRHGTRIASKYIV